MLATTQLDAVASGEEDNDISDTSGPPNPPPELEPQGTGSQQAGALNVPIKSNRALDILHFFTGVRPAQSGIFLKQDPAPKICRLCSYVMLVCMEFLIFILLMTSSEKYGTDKATLPGSVATFIYSPNTGNAILRQHLYQIHAEKYNKAVLEHKWTYRLSGYTSIL